MVKNVISAGRLATSLAPAPNQRVPEALATAVTVEEAEEVEVETTILSGVEARRPGMIGHRSHLSFEAHNSVHSYSCGGVGHLSRDCAQGSKCYNCSGFVRIRHAQSVGSS